MDPLTMAGIGAGVGAIGSYFNNSSNKKGQKQALGYLDQIPGYGHQYYDPYVQQGQQAQNNVNDQYQNLTNDPYSFYEQMMQNYTPSKGYQLKSGEMNKYANSVAASGGYAGTPQDEQNRMQLIEALSHDDMNEFYNKMVGIYGTGLQGQQNTATQGYNASSSLADYLGNVQGQKAGLSYQGSTNNANNSSNFLNNLMSMGGQAYGAYQGQQGLKGLGQQNNNIMQMLQNMQAGNKNYNGMGSQGYGGY